MHTSPPRPHPHTHPPCDHRCAQIRKVQRMKFMKELIEFSDASGHPLSRLPTIGGKELDLHLLYTLVSRKGGYESASSSR